MGYKSDEKINRKIKKQLEKQAKLEQNSNLPAKESGSIGKFFKRMRLKLGLGFTALAGLVGLGAALQNEKSDYEENLDNNAKIESESKDEVEKATRAKRDYVGSLKNIDITSETIVVEVEEPTTDIRQELEKQTTNYNVTPERESVEAEKVIEKAKEEVGLEKGEDTPEDSVIETTVNKGKDSAEIEIEKKTEPEPEQKNNNEKVTAEEETTKTVIDLDNEEKVPNAEEKEGFDLVIEHDKDDKVYMEDGTIIIEGDAEEEVVIGFEEETTTGKQPEVVTHEEETTKTITDIKEMIKEIESEQETEIETEKESETHDNGMIENINPFEDDWSR